MIREEAAYLREACAHQACHFSTSDPKFLWVMILRALSVARRTFESSDSSHPIKSSVASLRRNRSAASASLTRTWGTDSCAIWSAMAELEPFSRKLARELADRFDANWDPVDHRAALTVFRGITDEREPMPPKKMAVRTKLR